MDIMKRLLQAVKKEGPGIIAARLAVEKVNFFTINRLVSGNYPSVPKRELADKIERAIK